MIQKLATKAWKKWILNVKAIKHNKKANLLIISFDQWRGDWGDVYKPVVDLPALQRLAKEGLTLRRCYTNSPQCVPARFSWITGLEPSQLGVTENIDISLPPDAPSKIRQLRKNGWETTIIGKTHWSSHFKSKDIRESSTLIEQLGFKNIIEIPGPRALKNINCKLTDDWESEGWLSKQREDLKIRYGQHKTEEAWTSRETILPNHLYPDIWVSDRSEEQIDKLPNNSPWLIWISFVGPHEPFDTPKPWRGMTMNEELPKPIKERTWIRSIDEKSKLKEIERKWRGKITEKKKEELRRDYADHLRLLDDQVEIILNKISKRDDFDKTAIAVISDHGEMLGDGGMLYKSTFLESAIRVPMIYRPPGGCKKERKNNKPVNTTTVLNKILENLGNGGKISAIRESINKSKGAVVEFADERAFIKDNKKICLDMDGNTIWATDIKADPKELVNEAIQKGFSKKDDWDELRKWGIHITAKRKAVNWVWRDLIKSKCDRSEGE